MAYEILAAKLHELDAQLTQLSGRIHRCETAGHDDLAQEICALRAECEQSELALQSRLLRSRAGIVSALAGSYGEIERIIRSSQEELRRRAECQSRPDAASEEKILAAEYALDFALQAANRALLLSMEAIDAQTAASNTERKSS